MKSLYTSIAIIFMGLACWLAYNLIGSTVDADGFLQEPFALIPTGYLLVIIGGAATLVSSIRLALDYFAQPAT
jgi:hypothetical protein